MPCPRALLNLVATYAFPAQAGATVFATSESAVPIADRRDGWVSRY